MKVDERGMWDLSAFRPKVHQPMLPKFCLEHRWALWYIHYRTDEWGVEIANSGDQEWECANCGQHRTLPRGMVP